MDHMPSITLDTTLAELYSQARLDINTKKLAHLHSGLTSACDLTPGFSLNTKYVYLDSSFHNSVEEQPDDDARRSLATKMLSLVPQRDGFISGDSNMICFHTGHSNTTDSHDIAEFASTMSALDSKQRPNAIFCSGPSEVAEIAYKHNISTITSKVILDEVASAIQAPDSTLNSLIDVDKHWYFNCKVALAESGLPTPKAEVLCITLRQAETEHGQRQFLDTLISAIKARELPFVLKANQTFGGSGTWIISSASSRDDLISELTTTQLISKLCSFLTKDNEHLQICTFLLTDQIQKPISDIGLTSFVNTDGTSRFLGVSEQMIDSSTAAWTGSTITYSSQLKLEEEYTPIMHDIAAWLHGHDYVGPVGADILTTPSGSKQIVDLNVRTTGSLCLPLLKTHFTSRELDAASSFSLQVKGSRRDFVEKWKAEFEQGRFVIVAWYEEAGTSENGGARSMGDVVVGAENMVRLREVIAKVKEGSEDVTF